MENTTAAPTSETTTPAPAAPAMVPLGQARSLDEYREARSKGLTEIPAPTAKPADTPAPADEVPDPEVEADPELRAAIDELEAPTEQETPQEKAARTRRNKEAARKGYATRLQNKLSKLAAENEALRKQQTRPAAPSEPQAGGDPAAQRPAPQPPAPPRRPEYDGTHADDPEPTPEQFADSNDPFVEWTKAHNRWSARAEVRRNNYYQQQATQQAQSQTRKVEALRAFDSHANELRKEEPGFDAAIADLELSEPMQEVIFGAGKLGPRMALHLAKNPDIHRRLLAMPERQQLFHLGRIQAAVTAVSAPKPAAPAAPPITQAPAPHTPVGSAAQASSRFDIKSERGSVEEFRKHRDELARARR